MIKEVVETLTQRICDFEGCNELASTRDKPIEGDYCDKHYYELKAKKCEHDYSYMITNEDWCGKCEVKRYCINCYQTYDYFVVNDKKLFDLIIKNKDKLESESLK